MAVKFHIALGELKLASRGDPDLLEDEIDVGNHLGYRVFDLNPGVHLHEIELSIFVEKLHGADSEILQFAHRLRHCLTHGVARGFV